MEGEVLVILALFSGLCYGVYYLFMESFLAGILQKILVYGAVGFLLLCTAAVAVNCLCLLVICMPIRLFDNK